MSDIMDWIRPDIKGDWIALQLASLRHGLQVMELQYLDGGEIYRSLAPARAQFKQLIIDLEFLQEAYHVRNR